MPGITLWGVNVSPFVRKVRVALEEKGLDYDHQEVLPKMIADMVKQELPEPFLTASPLGRIPAITDNGLNIADSSVINQYLDKKYPETRLYPDDPEALAKTLWFENYADVDMKSVIYAKIFVERGVKPMVLKMDPDTAVVDQALSDELPPILAYLNSAVEGKAFINGSAFSAADIAVATHFVCLSQCEVTIDDQYSELKRYVAGTLDRAAFKTAIG